MNRDELKKIGVRTTPHTPWKYSLRIGVHVIDKLFFFFDFHFLSLFFPLFG